MPNSFESSSGQEKERKPIVQEFADEEWPSRKIGKEESRPPVTPEERERMDREIVALGNMMEGSGIWWQLDGALNISLREIARGGDYIGTHKDVDLSVFAEDLPQLKKHIEAKGYGLFYYERDQETKNRTFKEVDGDEVKPKWMKKFRIAAVDREANNINRNADLPLAGPIPHRRGANGEFIGWRGLVFPESWLKAEIVSIKGVEIPLSHPARFAFNKSLYADDAKYHKEDLEHFVVQMKALTHQDFEDIANVNTQLYASIERQKKTHEVIAKQIAEKVTKEMSAEERVTTMRESVPANYWKETYGRIAEEDPEAILKEGEEAVHALSKLGELTYENILSRLNEISYIDAILKNINSAKETITSMQAKLNDEKK